MEGALELVPGVVPGGAPRWEFRTVHLAFLTKPLKAMHGLFSKREAASNNS